MEIKRERPIQLKLRVNEIEHQIILEKMKLAELKYFSTYAREMLLNGKIVVKDFMILKKLRVEVNRIGVNINQIVKLANENQHVDNKKIEQLIFLQNDLLKRINKIIKENLVGD